MKVHIARTKRPRAPWVVDVRAADRRRRSFYETRGAAAAAAARLKMQQALARAAGLGHWPHDLLRHTAASYWLADVGDAGKVAKIFGNSPAILLSHYQALVTKAEVARFFTLAPL